MIQKLRVKFVASAMLSLFLVLTVIVATVNILNYRNIITEADNTLQLLQYNDGKFPIKNDPKETITIKQDGDPEGPNLSPELPYESRFFSVLLNEKGETISVDTANIAAINQEEASYCAQTVFQSKRTKGFYGNYRYSCSQNRKGMLVIFLDCTSKRSTFFNFLGSSCFISLLGLVAVLILTILFSGSITRPIAQSHEKQKRFITDAGHELKTPLTIIDADTEVLEMDLPDNEWLQDIRLQTRRLAALTNDLIFLSKMDEEQLPLQFIEFPLSDMVLETAQSFQALARTQEKDFAIHVEPLISINGEAKALQQLVSILLDNALKYSPAHDRITLSLTKNGRQIHLTVTNTAEHLDSENLNNLFDRFYRTDQSRNSKTGGYGLGLSIAKAIVQGHKGKISASSSNGNALMIQVILPENIMRKTL